MGSDLFALSALTCELKKTIVGARIDKIQQPEVDELRFFIRCQGKNQVLVMSCNAQTPRLHLTTSKKASPQNAPALCMLFRKHLINGVIEDVNIYNLDRIIQLKISAKTEMKDDAVFYVFIEIMNRYSNIVLTDENLIIMDAVKHLGLDIARDHIVLHGVKYAPVAQAKISYLTEPMDVFRNFEGGDLHKYILDNISGFAGTTASELLLRANIKTQTDKLTSEQLESISKVLKEFINIDSSTLFKPCIIGDKEVYPIIYNCLDNSSFKEFPSMSEAFDALYTDQDKGIRNRARLKNLASQAKKLHQKVEKNIVNDKERLLECEKMEDVRIFGELIVSNIYKIKKGDSSLHCLNYYTNEEVDIPLDERLTPSKNSTAYYTKYNKLKRTKEFVSKKLVEDENLLTYVMSIEDEIENLPFDADTAPIEEEIAMLGGGKRQSSKKKIRNPKADSPYIYLLDGFYIYRGKNNIQNDELTFKIASSNDIWMHLKNEHGAHTIIITEGKEVPEKIIKFAAEITASTKSASCEVDYTIRRNVKRQPNGHPGQVIYVNYKTILVNPDNHFEYLLK